MTQVRRQYRISSPTVDEINFIFGQLADRLDAQEGWRGTPQFQADVDFAGHKGTAAANATATTDLPTYGQIDSIINSRLATFFPVGTIHISTSSTNPRTYFGFGTWAAFGAGRVLVGLNAADTDFNTSEKTGGAKTSSLANHNHSIPAGAAQVDNNLDASTVNVSAGGGNTGDAGAATISIVQPYVVVYIFKRTA